MPRKSLNVKHSGTFLENRMKIVFQVEDFSRFVILRIVSGIYFSFPAILLLLKSLHPEYAPAFLLFCYGYAALH